MPPPVVAEPPPVLEPPVVAFAAEAPVDVPPVPLAAAPVELFDPAAEVEPVLPVPDDPQPSGAASI